MRSSRRLEAETARNLEVIWLLRGLRPDFKTIADFRKDNRHAFKPVFRQFVLLCRKLDLFGRELLAGDGTRLKAVNSTGRNFTREKLVKMIRSADERLADYLSRLDRTDAEEDGASGRPAKNLTEKIAALKERKTRHEGMLEELERTGLDDQLVLGVERDLGVVAHADGGALPRLAAAAGRHHVCFRARVWPLGQHARAGRAAFRAFSRAHAVHRLLPLRSVSASELLNT